MFGHDPPTYLRSTAATRCPRLAKVQAAIVDPVPPPRITRSYSSGSIFLGNGAEETFSILFCVRVGLAKKCFDSFGDEIALLGKICDVRRIAIPEADIVGRNEMKGVCKLWNQVAVHMGRGRKTVEKHNRWSTLVSGFAVEHFVAMDISAVVGGHLNSSPAIISDDSPV